MKNAKKNILIKISFHLIFLISMFIFPTPAIADGITIVADEWMPYCGKSDSTHPGYGIEIAQHVFEAVGHTISYKNVPWRRAIAATRIGEYNAIIGAIKKEAPDFIFPDEEFGMVKYIFFAKRGNTWTYKGLESLRTIVTGAITGYSYGEELDTYFKENTQQVQYVHSEDPLLQNIKKLIAGRFDVLIEDENVLLYKINKMGVTDKIVNAGSAGERINLYIAFSPEIAKSKEYAEIFSKGIRKLKNSGKLEKVLLKYGLTYWK